MLLLDGLDFAEQKISDEFLRRNKVETRMSGEIRKIGEICGTGQEFMDWVCETLANKGLLYEIFVEGPMYDFNIKVYKF